jgi:hypothetical protein
MLNDNLGLKIEHLDTSLSNCLVQLTFRYMLERKVTVLHFRYIGNMYINNRPKKYAISEDRSHVLGYYNVLQY